MSDFDVECPRCHGKGTPGRPVAVRPFDSPTSPSLMADQPPNTTAPAIQLNHPPGTIEVNIACPRCLKQNLYPVVPSQFSHSLQCSSCRSPFTCRIVQIRSKNSRGNKKNNTREFTVRVYNPGGSEDMIQFQNLGYQDFELRSGDKVIFSYYNGKLKIVQNMTIATYFQVSSGCYIATCVYGVDSPEVVALRCFRDDVLLPRRVLRSLVKTYYKVSPRVVVCMRRSLLLKAIIALPLYPATRLIVRYYRS